MVQYIHKLRVQQQAVRQSLNKESKKIFDYHVEAMKELSRIDKKINGKKDPKEKYQESKSSPMGNTALYQGDIILTKEEAKLLVDQAKMRLHAKKEGKSEKEIINKLKKNRAFRKISKHKWKFPIPYYVESEIIKPEIIHKALKGIEKETCVKFNKKDKPFSNKQGLRYFKGENCLSFIGPISNDSVQDISIGSGCEHYGIVQHETMHALGMEHEQSRPDRDFYIDINYENIDPQFKYTYRLTNIHDYAILGIPYDYGSLMHYDKYAFSANGQVTMSTKDPLYADVIGNKDRLQFNDIKLINKVHCAGKCEDNGLQCYYGGYPDPKNCTICKCPSMLAGDRCEKLVDNKKNDCPKDSKLLATSKNQAISFKGKKKCIHSITGEYGKKIKIIILNGKLGSSWGSCWPGVGFEIKFHKDKTKTGATFCDDVKNKFVISQNSEAFINYNGYEDNHYISLNYRAV
uniref:Zinc metalloproteinase n=1 Tax=Parastrongyloides trichosuri TaxID=131310 RepID=A0A0N5A6Q1_PARTI